MERKTYNVFGLTSLEFDERISLRDAYLSMYEYLNSYNQRCNGKAEVRDVLSEMSLWDNVKGDKAPMDGAVLPDWLEAVKTVQEAQKTDAGYRGADIRWKE